MNNNQENNTAEQILKKHVTIDEDDALYYEKAILNAMEEYASQLTPTQAVVPTDEIIKEIYMIARSPLISRNDSLKAIKALFVSPVVKPIPDVIGYVPNVYGYKTSIHNARFSKPIVKQEADNKFEEYLKYKIEESNHIGDAHSESAFTKALREYKRLSAHQQH